VQKRIVPLIIASEAKRGFAEDKMEQVSVDGVIKCIYVCRTTHWPSRIRCCLTIRFTSECSTTASAPRFSCESLDFRSLATTEVTSAILIEHQRTSSNTTLPQ